MPTASKVLRINGVNTGISSHVVNDTDDAQQLIRITTNLPDAEVDGVKTEHNNGRSNHPSIVSCGNNGLIGKDNKEDEFEHNKLAFLQKHSPSAVKYKLRLAASMTNLPDGIKTSHNNGKISSKTPKRISIKRKCSAPNCQNRVIQGGVCITHDGAKRKLCSHPGCTKAIKLAGFCSTHGPARKKYESLGCTRVAVQGGKCLSHGAKTKGKRASAEEVRERNRLHAQATRIRKKQRNQAFVESVSKLRHQQLCHIQAIADSSSTSQDDIVANAQVQELLLRRKSLNDIPSIADIHISESEIAIKETPHNVLPQERARVNSKRDRKRDNIKKRKTEELIEQLESENALLLEHLQGNVKKLSKEANEEDVNQQFNDQYSLNSPSMVRTISDYTVDDALMMVNKCSNTAKMRAADLNLKANVTQVEGTHDNTVANLPTNTVNTHNNVFANACMDAMMRAKIVEKLNMQLTRMKPSKADQVDEYDKPQQQQVVLNQQQILPINGDNMINNSAIAILNQQQQQQQQQQEEQAALYRNQLTNSLVLQAMISQGINNNQQNVGNIGITNNMMSNPLSTEMAMGINPMVASTVPANGGQVTPAQIMNGTVNNFHAAQRTIAQQQYIPMNTTNDTNNTYNHLNQQQQNNSILMHNWFDEPPLKPQYQKKKKKKKDKDKPKRPLSAYNYFFQAERGRMKKGGKIGFESLGRQIGAAWKKLDAEELVKYKDLAAADTIRYEEEMEAYTERMKHEEDKMNLKSQQDMMRDTRTMAQGGYAYPTQMPHQAIPMMPNQVPMMQGQSIMMPNQAKMPNQTMMSGQSIMMTGQDVPMMCHIPKVEKLHNKLGCIRVAAGGKYLGESHGAKRKEKRNCRKPASAEEVRERNRLHAQATRIRKKQRNQALVDSVSKLRHQQLCHIQAIADSSTSQDDIVANAQVQELLLRRKSLNDIPSIAGIHISESEIAIKEAPHNVLPQERERVHAKRTRKRSNIKKRKTEELIEQLESENALLLGHLQGNVKKLSKELLSARLGTTIPNEV